MTLSLVIRDLIVLKRDLKPNSCLKEWVKYRCILGMNEGNEVGPQTIKLCDCISAYNIFLS